MAKRLQLTVSHNLPHADARARMEALGEYYKNKHNAGVTWSGDEGTIVAKYLMLNIRGVVTVRESDIHMDGPDPGRLLRKKAQAHLKQKLNTYLDPATPLENLPTT